MAEERKPLNTTGNEFLWAFGAKIPKSQIPRIPLDMEPPKIAGAVPDQLDDDYWMWSLFRKPKLIGFLDIEKLSHHLQQEADQEYIERQQQRPAAEIEAEVARQEQLGQMVSAAMETDDPELWRRVDELLGK